MTQEHGEDAWDDILDRAGADGAYTAVGTYPDEELHGLVEAASGVTGMSEDDIVVWFGRSAMPMLHERYPEVFAGHERAQTFVLSLNDVIHPQVRKLFPGAYAPTFDFETPDENRVVLGYESYRNMCRFAEGLLQGAATEFGQVATVTHVACTRDGDAKCVLDCSFSLATSLAMP